MILQEKARNFYNIIDSVYDKDGREIGEHGKIYEDWFLEPEQISKLLYADYDKVYRWAKQSDEYNKHHPEAQSASLAKKKSLVAMWEALLQDDALPESIKTKSDLVKLRKEHNDIYYQEWRKKCNYHSSFFPYLDSF